LSARFYLALGGCPNVSDTIRTKQERLFIETLEDAVEALAAAVGGKKELACIMRPDLADDPEAARRWLLDALNSDRRTELHAIHIIRACKHGAKAGVHILKHWFDDATGYTRTDVVPAQTEAQKRARRMRELLDEFARLADEEAAEQRLRSV